MRGLSLSGLTVVAVLAMAAAKPAEAHCDTWGGPVVAAGQAALDAGEITPALKWIHAEREAELKAAFARTLKVRVGGGDARSLADTYFLETLVRLHREGEGAPYTGLKPAGSVDPAIAAADRAIEAGSVEDMARKIGNAAADGVRRRFERAARTRQSAGGSVAAGREYVEAYVEFIHYMEKLEAAAHGTGDHAH